MYIIAILIGLISFLIIILLGTGICIDNKCLPYNGMNKKEEKEYLKQFIKNNPEYAEEDCLLL
jgi:hypothetical protein